jgi:hypothetical protein
MTKTDQRMEAVEMSYDRARTGASPRETPLAWLSRRKGRDGQPMIGPAEHAAGERLAADLMRGGLLPGVTMAWSPVGRVDRSDGHRGLNPTESMVAASQRARDALDIVGPDLSGLMIDLCGFGKGLEQIEAERGWPARSAKLMARIALAQLARHYGLANVATGPRSDKAQVWRDAKTRPSVADVIASRR